MEKEKDILTNKIRKRRVKYNKRKVREMQDLEAKNLGISRYFDYYDFLIFKPPNITMLKRVCAQIKHYNRNLDSDDSEPFILFFEVTVQRVAAAIKIQCFYRNWVIRKHMKKSYAQTVIEWRAVLCIQAYWRTYKLKARIKANSAIKSHINSIKSNVLYIEETIYLNISYIFLKCFDKRKFKEQFFDFHFNENHNCFINYHNNFADSEGYREAYLWKNEPNALIHFAEKPCEVKDFNKIINYSKKAIEISSGLRFIEIVTPSIDDAKKRASIFAYMTYNVKNQSFVKLF